jgi:hypothetical protein
MNIHLALLPYEAGLPGDGLFEEVTIMLNIEHSFVNNFS